MLAQFLTLVDALRYHARERPYDTAVTSLLDGEQESVSWTYRDLDQRGNEIAATLRRGDLSGERALLLLHFVMLTDC
jgi:acyl-CoA synthetase (AMP-forming)/AMP-acid ligase II